MAIHVEMLQPQRSLRKKKNTSLLKISRLALFACSFSNLIKNVPFELNFESNKNGFMLKILLCAHYMEDEAFTDVLAEKASLEVSH